MAIATMQIKGVPELLAKLSPDLAALPARNFLERGVIIIQTHARQLAPVDRGGLRNSIVTEVDSASFPKWGRVGSNLDYAPDMEFGAAPHWAPLEPLEAWAQRKGMGARAGAAIRHKIAMVGITPHPYLQPGMDASVGELNALVPIMAAEIQELRGL